MVAFVVTAVELFSDELINLRNLLILPAEKAEEETLEIPQSKTALNAELMSKLDDNASYVVMNVVCKLVSENSKKFSKQNSKYEFISILHLNCNKKNAILVFRQEWNQNGF